jgi:hypothetical protein
MTSSEPTFRSVTTSDIDELIGMMRELFSSDHVHFDEAMARKGLGAITAPLGVAPPGHVWMIESNGQSAGYLVLTSRSVSSSAAGTPLSTRCSLKKRSADAAGARAQSSLPPRPASASVCTRCCSRWMSRTTARLACTVGVDFTSIRGG